MSTILIYSNGLFSLDKNQWTQLWIMQNKQISKYLNIPFSILSHFNFFHNLAKTVFILLRFYASKSFHFKWNIASNILCGQVRGVLFKWNECIIDNKWKMKWLLSWGCFGYRVKHMRNCTNIKIQVFPLTLMWSWDMKFSNFAQYAYRTIIAHSFPKYSDHLYNVYMPSRNWIFNTFHFLSIAKVLSLIINSPSRCYEVIINRKVSVCWPGFGAKVLIDVASCGFM